MNMMWIAGREGRFFLMNVGPPVQTRPSMKWSKLYAHG
jgi:hypothetical protein